MTGSGTNSPESGRLPGDMDKWLATKHGTWDDCPAALAADSQWSADNLVSHLRRLKDMVRGEGSLVEDLMGLPLEGVREKRRMVLNAERERAEAEARRRAEAAKKAAEEALRRQAEQERIALITLASEELAMRTRSNSSTLHSTAWEESHCPRSTV